MMYGCGVRRQHHKPDEFGKRFGKYGPETRPEGGSKGVQD